MLTQSEQNELRRRTGWSDAIVGNIRSVAEAEIYIGAGLKEARVGSRPALIRSDIDWSAFNCRREWLKTKFADYDRWKDYNNADLIGEGYPPRDASGDFRIGDYTFEVGGHSKKQKQINGIPNSFVVKADIDFPGYRTLPLWHFGLMY